MNIDQLFTEVTLEKLTNEPYGLKREELAHHRHLFKMPQMEIEESEPKNKKTTAMQFQMLSISSLQAQPVLL